MNTSTDNIKKAIANIYAIISHFLSGLSALLNN